MSWRYQPVFIEENGERYYSLCEVYFDAKDKLETWTEESSIAPGGADPEELTGDLARMMVDAFSYVPVRFADLKVGMVFERKVSMADRHALAEFVEHTKDAFKRQPKPTPN